MHKKYNFWFHSWLAQLAVNNALNNFVLYNDVLLAFKMNKSRFFGRVPSIISSVISSPAILAVIKDTQQPDTKALNATLVIEGRFSGASALRAPIIIPIELGFAKPQIAKVAIAADRS